MGLLITVITTTFIIVTALLVKSRRALRTELDSLKVKTINEVKQPAIYEEINGGSLKSSSPSIDIGENAAYESVFTNSAGQNTYMQK